MTLGDIFEHKPCTCIDEVAVELYVGTERVWDYKYITGKGCSLIHEKVYPNPEMNQVTLLELLSYLSCETYPNHWKQELLSESSGEILTEVVWENSYKVVLS